MFFLNPSKKRGVISLLSSSQTAEPNLGDRQCTTSVLSHTYLFLLLGVQKGCDFSVECQEFLTLGRIGYLRIEFVLNEFPKMVELKIFKWSHFF